MMSRVRAAVALVVLVVAGVLPTGTALAADVVPTVTMAPIDPIVYRGETQAFEAVVTNGGPGGVFFQVSYDGTTWETLTGSSQGGDGWHSYTTVPDDAPLGPRFIRAHHYAGNELPDADSDPQEQTVARRDAVIESFIVGAPAYESTLPGTPISLGAVGLNGSVEFDRLVDGTWQELEGVQRYGTQASLNVGPLGEGTHTFRARIDEWARANGTTEERTITITRAVTTPEWYGALTVQTHHELPVTISVTAPPSGLNLTGSVTISNAATSAVVASGAVGEQLTLAAMLVGTHNFVVSYGGDVNFAPSSRTFTVTVTPDLVEATNVVISYATFYPYTDGYRDALRISGSRQEPISASIRVYSPTGSLVRSASVARATGAYAYSWNGRYASGSLLPAGRYKVVQTLTDAAGTTKTISVFVNLSHKRLVTKTSYITKFGNAVSASGREGTGRVAVSSTGRYARLAAGSDGWAGVGYAFTLPAAVAYKSIAFQIYGTSSVWFGYNEIGLQSFAACPYSSTASWDSSCFNHWKPVPWMTSRAWVTASGHPTHNRHDRLVRGMVSVGDGTVYVYTARLKVVYSVLQ
jgi:hypothetical protein